MATNLDRRQLLKGAGLATLGGGALAALTPAAAQADDDQAGVVGAWRLTIVDQSGATTQGVAVFSPGGGFSETDSGSPFVGLGAWISTGGHRFGVTFDVFTFDTAQKFAGTVEVRAEGRVQGDSMSGRFAFDVTDPTGKVVFSGTGTFTAKRFRVKPV